MTAIKKQRATTIGDAMRASILAAGQTPGGFSIDGHNSAQYHCNLLIADGLLFRAWVNLKLVRFFTSPEKVAQFMAANPWIDTRPHRNRDPAPRVKVKKPTYAEVNFLRSAAGKLYTPPAPRKDAEIVHTAQTRYSSRMMVDRYAVSVPFVKIGQAGWAMSVGGAA